MPSSILHWFNCRMLLSATWSSIVKKSGTTQTAQVVHMDKFTYVLTCKVTLYAATRYRIMSKSTSCVRSMHTALCQVMLTCAYMCECKIEHWGGHRSQTVRPRSKHTHKAHSVDVGQPMRWFPSLKVVSFQLLPHSQHCPSVISIAVTLPIMQM